MANHDSAKSPVKTRKLTTKQAKFVKGVVQGKPAYKVAAEVYDVKDLNSASTIAVENLQKVTIQQALEKAYEKQGITVEALVKPLADGLVANRVAAIEGDFYETEVPDHSTRLKAASIAAQWMGIGKTQEGGTTNYNFVNVSSETKDKFGL